MTRIIRNLVILLLFGGAGFAALTSPAVYEALRGDGQLTASSSTRDLERGKTLFTVGGCASCHMTPDQPDRTRLGGGLVLKTQFGNFNPPNISSDAKDGIGAWSEHDFIRAMREGISPDGRHYYPAFPYTSYRHMNPDDLADLFAYLKTLPGVEGRAPQHDLPFPFNIRRALGVWKLAFLNGSVVPSKGSPLEQGRYLVEGPGHCAECHSPRNLLGAIRDELRYSGAPDAEGRGWVSNITPHERGIGAWSQDEIVELLKTGFTPEFDAVGGSMVDVVKNTSQLTDDDRKAMAEYLKSLPPRAGLDKPAKAATP